MVPEWIPTVRGQVGFLTMQLDDLQAAVALDFADGGEWDPLEGARYSVGLAGAHGEEEFVVVATVQREIEGVDILDPEPTWLARRGNP
jgi:hypothetical protein